MSFFQFPPPPFDRLTAFVFIFNSLTIRLISNYLLWQVCFSSCQNDFSFEKIKNSIFFCCFKSLFYSIKLNYNKFLIKTRSLIYFVWIVDLRSTKRQKCKWRQTYSNFWSHLNQPQLKVIELQSRLVIEQTSGSCFCRFVCLLRKC